MAKIKVFNRIGCNDLFCIILQCVENNSLLFEVFHIIDKEIMLQCPRDFDQQSRINTFTLENIVHIGAVATQLVRQPGSRTPLTIKFFFDYFSDVYHGNKKGGTIRDLFCPEEPPSTLHANKHEQSTPKNRT